MGKPLLLFYYMDVMSLSSCPLNVCSCPEITTVVNINLRITRDPLENMCLENLGHSDAQEVKPNSSSQVDSYSYPRFRNHYGRGGKRM